MYVYTSCRAVQCSTCLVSIQLDLSIGNSNFLGWFESQKAAACEINITSALLSTTNGTPYTATSKDLSLTSLNAHSQYWYFI